VKEISKHTDNFRILALSATPGADTRAIESVIKSLRITKIEARNEDDPDVKEYTHHKQIEVVKCKLGADSSMLSVKDRLIDFIRPSCQYLFEQRMLHSACAESLNMLVLSEANR